MMARRLATTSMPRHSTAALILLLDVLRRAGEEPMPVLARFGLEPDRLDPTAVLDEAVELRINTAIAESLSSPLAGLRAGANFGIASYGPFTLLLLTCRDVLHALRTGIEYQSLSFLFGHLSFRPGRHRSAVLLSTPPLQGAALRFRIDLEVAGTLKLMHDILHAAGADAGPSRIVMPYAAPAEAAAYGRAFGCPVDWGGREACFELENEVLRRRFTTADPGAHEVLRQQARRLLAAMDGETTSLSQQLRAHLAACVGSMPSAAEAAAVLGLSERSLRRQLQDEASSYRRILDEVRREKAEALLRDDRLPVESIAQRLGYSEAASFIHAFKRWTGTTPAAFRRRDPVGSRDRNGPTTA